MVPKPLGAAGLLLLCAVTSMLRWKYPVAVYAVHQPIPQNPSQEAMNRALVGIGYKSAMAAPSGSLPVLLSQLMRKITDVAGGVPRFSGVASCPDVPEMLATAAAQASAAVDGRAVACETGFGAGHSSGAFLWAGLAVHSFDLFDQSQQRVANFLQALFPDTYRIYRGDFHTSIPAAIAKGLRCDLVYVDAHHPDDLRLLQPVARNGAILLYHSGGAGDVSARSWVQQHPEQFEEIACLNAECKHKPVDEELSVTRTYCLGRIL